MSRLALPPTDMFIGHHVLIGMSMGMGCLCRNDAPAPSSRPSSVWLRLAHQDVRSADNLESNETLWLMSA